MWSQASVPAVSIAQGASVLTPLLSGIDIDVLRLSTVLRVVGVWTARAETSDADGSISAAIYVQQEEGFTAGAHPELETDNFSYMWTDKFYARFGETLSGENKYTTFHLDVRSKRRLSGEKILIFKRENNSPAVLTFASAFDVRILLAL